MCVNPGAGLLTFTNGVLYSHPEPLLEPNCPDHPTKPLLFAAYITLSMTPQCLSNFPKYPPVSISR